MGQGSRLLGGCGGSGAREKLLASAAAPRRPTDDTALAGSTPSTTVATADPASGGGGEEAAFHERDEIKSEELEEEISGGGARGEGVGGEDDDCGDRPAEDEGVLRGWRLLYRELVLTLEDREKIKTNRGLTDEAIDRHGFRSSRRENRTILLSPAAGEMVAAGVNNPMDDWLHAGLFVKDKAGHAVPNPKFCGLGWRANARMTP
jgi:hypothetical protein